jgi:hypothetical protein
MTGIYIGFSSSRIIRFLEPLGSSAGEVFSARFAACIFDETVFPKLGGGDVTDITKFQKDLPFKVYQEMEWNKEEGCPPDPRTQDAEA